MTAAQAAAFRILCDTPRERVRSHEWRAPTKVYYYSGTRVKTLPPHIAKRRAYIREHMATMSQRQMAAELGISRRAVQDHILAIQGKPNRRKCAA